MKASLLVCGFLMGIGGLCGAADVPSVAPALVQKKILVVYYSRTGNTERVASDLAARLGADIEKIADAKDRSGVGGYLSSGKQAAAGTPAEIGPSVYDPAGYDLVVLGTPIWSWTMTPAARAYLSRHRDAIKAAAFFTTSGSTKPDTTVHRMEQLLGKKAIAFTGFNQSVLKNTDKYNALLDDFVRRIAVQQ